MYRKTDACSQRSGCPPPSPRAWGVPWARLVQAWHSGCALCPGTSCTKEDLLKGQRSSQRAGTPVSPGSWPRLGLQQEPPLTALPFQTSGQREKEQGPGAASQVRATQVPRGQDAAWQVSSPGQSTGRRQEAECSNAWTVEPNTLSSNPDSFPTRLCDLRQAP